MIVASQFDGDNDKDLMCAQHEAYSRALTIIIQTCTRRWRQAEALLEITTELGSAIKDKNFDHHVVQDAHDLLAAVWRAQHGLVHRA